MLTNAEGKRMLECIPSRRKVVALVFVAALIISMTIKPFLNRDIGALTEMNIDSVIKQYLNITDNAETPSCSVYGNTSGVVVNTAITIENIKMFDQLRTGIHKMKFIATLPAVNKSRKKTLIGFSKSSKLGETDACVFINGRKRGLAKMMHEVNFNGTKCWGKNPKFRDKNNPRTALASFTGSGNTWSRHLLEYISGIYTGSVYRDWTLRNEFKAESIADSHVIAIKTHENYKADNIEYAYAKAILLTRNLDETLLASYNLVRTNSHTKALPQSMVYSTDWQRFVKALTGQWKNFHLSWLNDFKGKLMVLSYRRLKEDFFNEMFRLGVFLNVTMTYRTLWCAHERREGKFHRHSTIDKDAVFTKDMLASIASAQREIEYKIYSMFGEEARATY